MSTFGKRLKKALEDKNLKAADLNRILGRPVRNTAVYEWLKDRAKPLADELSKVSIALDVSIDWLLLGKEINLNEHQKSTVSIEKDEYIEFLHWKNKKLEKENSGLKSTSETISKH